MPKFIITVPFEKKDKFKELCRKESVPFSWDGEKRDWSIEIEKIPQSLLEEGFAEKNTRFQVIDCDYTYFPFASKAGAKWDPNKKVIIFRGSSVPIELTGFRPKPYSYPAKIERELNNEKEKILAPTKKIKPYPHQEENKKIITNAWRNKLPGFLLADSVGLGKTISSWTSILEINKIEERPLKILICGPLNCLETWRETINWLGNGGDKKEANDITIINYDKLKNLFSEGENKKAKTLKGRAKFGKAERYDIILFDESHYLKNPASARTKLARKLEDNARFLLWVSATAGQNPLELSYLSNLLAHLTNQRKGDVEKEFEKWCQSVGINVKRGKFGKWTWEPTDKEKDNEKMYELLFKKKIAATRRRCSDIEGWPEIQRIPKAHEFNDQERRLYETEWEEFIKALEEDKLARLKGKKDTAKGIAQLGRLRQKASLLRIETTCNQAEELLENGMQVAISVEYLKSLDEIKANLEKRGYQVVEFSGRNTGVRENMRKQYQSGDADVIIFSTETSISLHQEKPTDKPRAQIDHDLRWSGIEQEQVDGRSHRNGTHAPVYWCFTKNTIEERVATILLGKIEGMNTIRGDTDVSFTEIYKQIAKV